MKTPLDAILDDYGKLLETVDEWFARSIAGDGKNIACAGGCSECCRGLFDVTLLDAMYMRRGVELLEPGLRRRAMGFAAGRLACLREIWPELEPPYMLNVRPEEDWEALMPDDDETPCPLLGDDGLCLVYRYRPMTCRLHGIPLVDESGEIMHDEWCTLNYTAEDPLSRPELRWGFRACFKEELSIFRRLTDFLMGKELNELDTLIPLAVLVDLKSFDWKDWWLKNAGKVREAGFPENDRQAPETGI
ncbi:MAG: YkgJ family cysteine cluster protein [Geobacteraceae bacterium]|nr:YkgJ family cysteine cluster protein [Geobacteraceae bacterium]